MNPANEQPSVGGLTPQQFVDEFNQRTNYSKASAFYLAPFAYDAVWAVALALNHTLMKLESSG